MLLKDRGRVYVTKEVDVETTADVEVDITEEVEEEISRRLRQVSPREGLVDVDAAVIALLRMERKGLATPGNVLALLLDRIGSDALTREVRRVLDLK